MRDQYAGDISDYLKFAFLRSAAPLDAQLGVAWYYLPVHDGRADGRHEEYLDDPGWSRLDPDLFARLRRRSQRSIAELECLSVAPGSPVFHNAPVAPRRERAAWREAMVNHLQGCDVVFADPDNGVSRPGIVSRKSATVDEIRALRSGARLVFLIRFPHRLTSHDDQLASYHAAFSAFTPITLRICVRVPNRNGTTSPRIRWFTALNPRPDTAARMQVFAQRLKAVPGATVRLDA